MLQEVRDMGKKIEIEIPELPENMRKAFSDSGKLIGQKADELKKTAEKTRDDISEKITKLDRELEQAITRYNDAYTLMNDRGIQLFVERNREMDLIANIEDLVNSIANRPKSFDSDFEEIRSNREMFDGAQHFADRELQEARKAAGSAGAGLAAGASVAVMGPTAAMWIATTFGTASTGAAISTLSGAAAANAAVAWLGGGAVAAGGGGMAAGNALLALAGPVGWTIAGATLLTSIVIYSRKQMQLNKEKAEEIQRVYQNRENVMEIDGKLQEILSSSREMRERLVQEYRNALKLYGRDYSAFDEEDKKNLGSMVNITRALSGLMTKTVE